jgi:hypothetical protein
MRVIVALPHRNINPKPTKQSKKSNKVLSKSVQRKAFKSTDYTNAKKVSHGDLRDDRPPHGRGGRASKDGLEQHPCLTASSPSMALVHKLRNLGFYSPCRQVNAMANLYAWVPANANPLKTKTKDAGPPALLSNTFQPQKYVAYIFSIHKLR